MIFTSCTCNEPYTVDYECGNKMGYTRIDCKCGNTLMVELLSFGETVIFDDKKELNKFIKDKELLIPNK